METETDKLSQEPDLASFSERVLAFSLDGAIFVLGYHLSFGLLLPADAGADKYAIWTALWTFLFLIYQAYFSCEGRVSLGKRLLGLRVVGLDREPLSLGQAAMRSAAYLVSSILNLGFLWSLFNPARQCWHDMAVGSLVVVEHPKGLGAMRLARAGSLACLALLAGAWAWTYVWEPRYHRIMTMAYAHVGLAEMQELQKAYHERNGRYAESVFALSSVSPAPMNFLADMAALFDPEAGISITATDKGYTIVARARDPWRTPVSISSS